MTCTASTPAAAATRAAAPRAMSYHCAASGFPSTATAWPARIARKNARRQPLPPGGPALAGTDRADERERQCPDVKHQAVRHLYPAKERPGDDRDIPAGAGTVQDQPDHQDRHGRADVVR